ncbi:MAG: GNAT family N-acetyltransferase, partial [Thermoplasmata archaeon]
MSAVSASRVRLARLTDFRALGAFYSHRDKTDRAMFHPFPEGRLIAPLVFLILLASQRVNRTLLRLHPTWAFIFVVYPGESQGAIDGFVYLRVRRKENEGYVANIGTQVGPLARGRGVGALLITLLIDEARTLGVVRIETEAYEENNASIRMCEKLGFKLPADPTSGRQRDEFGIAVTMVLNLAARVESGRPASAVTPGPAPVLSRTAASTRPVLRKGKLSDFWALGKLYSDRSDEDRANFHPFPEGRLIAPLVFLVLLACQRFRQQLIRIHASWAFAFVVNPGARPGTINGFAYLRVRRREPSGYVGNIGPLVGPLGRGNGLSRYLIATLINDARTWGLRRVEVEVYVRNTASVRMGEKLGSKAADEPTAASKKDAYGVMITQVLDVDQVVPPSAVTSTLPAHREEPSRSLVATDSAEPASVPKPSRFRRADVAALIALMASFAVIATLRLLILFSYPYPPSGDVAEQLYWSHIWLGTAFPSPATIWDVPPVYLFLVYIPLTHLFPLFTGQRLLMGVVPALLAFPTYLLLRECRVNRFFSVFGASLLALAAPVSLMVTWNAGYDLFGMFWALLFFAGLVGALRTHRRSYMLLAAVSFGLTAGSHDFAFVFICLAFGLIIALALLLLPDRRATFRSFGIVLGVGLLCAAPFALIYYTLAGETANVGGAVTIGALKTLGRGFLPFSWAAVDTWSTLVYVDAAVSLLAIGVVVWRRLRRPETPVLLGILLSAASLSIAYPQVADRGLYFLPLGLYPVVAVFCQILYDAFSSRDTASPLEGLPPDAAPAARLQAEALQLEISEPSLDLRRSGWVLRQRRSRRWLKPTVAIVLIAAFLIPNAEQSLTVMSGAEHYYIELTPDEVPILNWLAHNTPANAAVYSSSSGLEKWIWGYANRQSFAPTSLNLD